MANTVNERFDTLVRQYYHAWFRFHPESAVDVGIPGFDHLLTPFRPSRLGPLVCLNDELLVGLDEIDEGALDDDRRLDARLLRGAAAIENTRILEIDRQRVDPQRALPINAIYQLTIRAVDDPPYAMSERIAAIPSHLKEAREYFDDVAEKIPPMWLDSTVASARAGADFIRHLPAGPGFRDRFGVKSDTTSFDKASLAINAFAEYLQRDVRSRAKGDLACGKHYFSLLLSSRHGLDVSAEQIRQLGEELFAQTLRDLDDACRAVGANGGMRDVLTQAQSDHPSAGELINAYREAMQAARAFVVSHRLVSIPSTESLEIVETPSFLRQQIPFAAYQDPAPMDPAQRGYYYVTPPTNDDELKAHDRAGLQHTCVHEAWPGHHLQFVTANQNPSARSLPRLLNPSATLYEGWALYCEQLMHERGFLSQPIQRVLLLRDRLWRALRILIDVDLHTSNLGTEEAADLLVTHLGFTRSQAVAEITWYSRAPTVPLGYAVGWSIINALRDRARAEMRALDLREFHDRLLSIGSVGLPMVVQRAFGVEKWETIQRMLFASTATVNS